MPHWYVGDDSNDEHKRTATDYITLFLNISEVDPKGKLNYITISMIYLSDR